MEYRWDELLDGQAHLYRAGRDFDLPPEQFAELIEQTAAGYGLTAVIRVDGRFVAFQAARAAHSPAPALSYGAEQDVEQMVQLRAQGLTYKQIGQRYNMPHYAVSQAVKKHVKQAADA